MAGSERILRVHHRNTVQSRALELQMCKLDSVCRRNINKIKQEMHEIYFQELLPLKRELGTTKSHKPMPRVHAERRIKNTHKRNNAENSRKQERENSIRRCDIPREDVTTQRVGTNSGKMNDTCILPPIAKVKRSQNCRIGLCRHDSNMEMLKISALPRSGPVHECSSRNHSVSLYDYDSSSKSPSPCPPDDGRLMVIQKAIYLTSKQPEIPEANKNRRLLRKSFLINLRRQSKAVWELETLRRVTDCFTNERKESYSFGGDGEETLNSFSVDDEEILNTHSHENSFNKESISSSSECMGNFSHTSEFTTFDFSDNDDYCSSTPDIFDEIKVSEYGESDLESDWSTSSESGYMYDSDDSFIV